MPTYRRNPEAVSKLTPVAASQFNPHEQETPDVRVLFTPY
jgi:hypothetical protein